MSMFETSRARIIFLLSLVMTLLLSPNKGSPLKPQMTIGKCSNQKDSKLSLWQKKIGFFQNVSPTSTTLVRATLEPSLLELSNSLLKINAHGYATSSTTMEAPVARMNTTQT